MDFLFPIYALYILKKNVPKFFQANSCEVVRSTPFFVRNPTIQPRVDFGHDWEWTARYNDNYGDEKGRPSTSKKMSHDGEISTKHWFENEGCQNQRKAKTDILELQSRNGKLFLIDFGKILW